MIPITILFFPHLIVLHISRISFHSISRITTHRSLNLSARIHPLQTTTLISISFYSSFHLVLMVRRPLIPLFPKITHRISPGTKFYSSLVLYYLNHPFCEDFFPLSSWIKILAEISTSAVLSPLHPSILRAKGFFLRKLGSCWPPAATASTTNKNIPTSSSIRMS